MTNDELLKGVSELYSNARNSVWKYVHADIKRGRKHSISSMAEDLLAYFIHCRTGLANTQIWVDYPITFASTKEGKARAKTIYADIAIVKRVEGRPVVCHIVDLKLDLGWKRSLDELKASISQAIIRTDEMRKAKLGQCRELDETGIKIQKASAIEFSPTLTWHLVVMSDQNIPDAAMKQNVSYATKQQLENSSFKFYVFSELEHPNGGAPKPIHGNINSFIDGLTK
jgi:hypothetical protein